MNALGTRDLAWWRLAETIPLHVQARFFYAVLMVEVYRVMAFCPLPRPRRLARSAPGHQVTGSVFRPR